MSRPEKISAELTERICDDICRGYTYDQAAQRNGISPSTFYRWMLLGRNDSAPDLYKCLVKDVSEASDFSEAEALQLIRNAAVINRDWKAAAWTLSHRYPDKYSKSTHREGSDCKKCKEERNGE